MAGGVVAAAEGPRGKRWVMGGGVGVRDTERVSENVCVCVVSRDWWGVGDGVWVDGDLRNVRQVRQMRPNHM